MLGSAARKERKERKKREKKAGGGGGGASKSSSSVVSSSQGTHDSAQTLTNDKTPISPIPETATPQSKAKKSAEAMNTSGDSTTTASTAAATKKKKKSKDTPSEEEESLLQKRWFRWLAGAACSIAAVSTGTKLWMRKEENVQVKKEDVATPAAAGAKKKRGN